MENQFHYEQQNQESTPAPQEPVVQSYTAPPHDRYTPYNHEQGAFTPPTPAPKKKEGKQVPFSTAVVASAVVSVVSSLLVLLIIV